MTQKQTLDVRAYPCPEPADMLLEAVDSLVAGQYLEVIHDKEPKLIYAQLQKRGFEFLVQKDDGPMIKMLIWRLQDNEAKNAVDAAVA